MDAQTPLAGWLAGWLASISQEGGLGRGGWVGSKYKPIGGGREGRVGDREGSGWGGGPIRFVPQKTNSKIRDTENQQ